MHIDHQIAPFVVYADDPVAHALKKISGNRAGLIYCVSPHGVLEGVLSDGDFRRWIVDVDIIDLDQPVRSIVNRDCVTARLDDEPTEIAALFSARIKSIPLLDDNGRLHAVAWPRDQVFTIGGYRLGPDDPVFVIAEIGNNHNGSLDSARTLIDHAADAGASAVKFQLRDMDRLYVQGGDPTDASADLGTQYTLDLLARFQLTPDELFAAMDHARERGVLPMCTPFDLRSLQRLESYGVEAYKIASADLTNHDLLTAAAATGKPLIVSTGMSTEDEIVESIDLLTRRGAAFALLHCNSTYPAPIHDIHLVYMDRLEALGASVVGYSGHERGTAVAIAAVARGARIIEKHFTLDRDLEGNDHKVSLLPYEFAGMVRSIRNVSDALGRRTARTVSQGERLNREVLAKSIVAQKPIRRGDVIDDSMIDVKSPGRGLQPNRRDDLVGRTASRAMEPGDFFFESDLTDEVVLPSHYSFSRPWGIPVRYHDWERLVKGTNPDLLEIHLSYRDLDLDGPSFFPERTPYELVVHAPELFAGDHLLDLASGDDAYRKRSITELQRVIDLTRSLRERFVTTGDPLIIVNAGGFSFDGPVDANEVARRYERVAAALELLDEAGTEIIPQTMPPFPWHMGGQRYHNLFLDAQDITRFCHDHERRICFDVSHSKLTSNHRSESFRDFVAVVAPYTAHLHIVDASGIDGEGLQIGDGELDFGFLADELSEYPDISFIPEVWQGHKNRGQGFWIALSRLEQWF